MMNGDVYMGYTDTHAQWYNMSEGRENIFSKSFCLHERNYKYHAFYLIDLRFCFCVNRRDCKRDAFALLTDLTQQNTGKSSPLLYPALPTGL